MSTQSQTIAYFRKSQHRWLQWLYISIVTILTIIFVTSLPHMYEHSLKSAMVSQSTLSTLEVSAEFIAMLNLALDSVFLLGFTTVALMLFWQRSKDTMAYSVSLMLLTTGFLYGTNVPNDHPLWVLDVLITALAETFQVCFFYTFPNGHFLPKWTRYGVIPLYMFRALIWLNIRINNVPQGAFEVGLVVLLMLIGIGTQVYRYRKLSTPTQRQQMKWLLAGLIVAVTIVVPSIYLTSITSTITLQNNLILYLVIKFVRNLAMLSVPLAITFAVLRYRLWDIDLTINRSLVGAIVTVILGAIFFGGFLLLNQTLIMVLGKAQSELSLGIVGVIVGLAFTPIHRRVRHFVDRKLYNFRFDLNELHRAQKKPTITNPAALTGQIISDYEVLDLIGRGGMGEVYKGYKEGQVVAIKILPTGLEQKVPEIRVRLEREGQALQNLDHPKVVKLYNVDTSCDTPYLILEYIEGLTLNEYLANKKAIDLDEFKKLASQVAEVVGYVHANGMVHRDMKPSNIMLRNNAQGELEPVLMDFGIAKGTGWESSLTGTNAVGTIDYMAPEQIESARDVEIYADIYAIGVVFFEMLTGQRPFQGNPGQVLFAHLQQPPPDVRKLRPEIPESLSYVIMRALAKDPANRFPTAEAMREAILAA